MWAPLAGSETSNRKVHMKRSKIALTFVALAACVFGTGCATTVRVYDPAPPVVVYDPAPPVVIYPRYYPAPVYRYHYYGPRHYPNHHGHHGHHHRHGR
jgi:hypothetical protein